MPGPAVLQPYDADWPRRAARLLAAVEQAVEPLRVAESFEHIGSTSVPGLAAKACLDLQVQVSELPPPELLDRALAPTGFVPTTGSRPDSPGVHRDIPRGSEQVPDEVWRKRLFVCDIEGPGAAILHVRLTASPWGRYAVWFRDWLRAHPEARDRYASFKAGVAAEHAGDADYDDYTRAKTAFFDEVQDQFEAWGRRR
ncbi:GrpB family protein [Kineococcus rubinsiae]|uniref:GrpB family protein n=1 Tax=Kineococcus rubinsiae TaxID=2609562 RepID=UPI0014319664|nr:GrpB family protein [Kineococcus rubinsiae]NIZ91362.1 GrpB family protein [Kineococcus rubinsiae]